MMYGELAKQNASYQTGHNTGSLRACGYMQNRFDEIVREYESGHAWQYAETESGLEWF